jgi:hypothetical protein
MHIGVDMLKSIKYFLNCIKFKTISVTNEAIELKWGTLGLVSVLMKKIFMGIFLMRKFSIDLD